MNANFLEVLRCQSQQEFPEAFQRDRINIKCDTSTRPVDLSTHRGGLSEKMPREFVTPSLFPDKQSGGIQRPNYPRAKYH